MKTLEGLPAWKRWIAVPIIFALFPVFAAWVFWAAYSRKRKLYKLIKSYGSR